MADEGGRSELASFVLEARTVQEHLSDIARRAGTRLGDGTHCTVSLRHGGLHRVAASDGSRPAACDEVEFRHGSGPCLTAMDDRSVVLVPDVRDESRWRPWRDMVERVGFRSAAAVPAQVRDGADIALNLYSDAVDPWNGEALARAEAFAREVAGTVGLCLRVADLAQRVESLRDAVLARDVVNQAVGAVMATNRCTTDEALELLRAEIGRAHV